MLKKVVSVHPVSARLGTGCRECCPQWGGTGSNGGGQRLGKAFQSQVHAGQGLGLPHRETHRACTEGPQRGRDQTALGVTSILPPDQLTADPRALGRDEGMGVTVGPSSPRQPPAGSVPCRRGPRGRRVITPRGHSERDPRVWVPWAHCWAPQ